MALANLSTIANDCYIGGQFYTMWWLAGDAHMKCGFLTGAHASNDAEMISTYAATVSPAAVAALQADVDIDTALSDASMYEFYMLGAGTLFNIPHDGTIEAILKGKGLEGTAGTARGTVKSWDGTGQILGYTIRTYDTTEQEWLKMVG